MLSKTHSFSPSSFILFHHLSPTRSLFKIIISRKLCRILYLPEMFFTIQKSTENSRIIIMNVTISLSRKIFKIIYLIMYQASFSRGIVLLFCSLPTNCTEFEEHMKQTHHWMRCWFKKLKLLRYSTLNCSTYIYRLLFFFLWLFFFSLFLRINIYVKI